MQTRAEKCVNGYATKSKGNSLRRERLHT